jgi:hypothetical protein
MKDTKFNGYNHRVYKVIQKHPKFQGVWRCYPDYFKVPSRPFKGEVKYYQEEIKLFAEDYIKENLVD